MVDPMSPVTTGPDQIFRIPRSAGYRRRCHTNHAPAGLGCQPVRNLTRQAQTQSFVAHDTGIIDDAGAGLELRLRQDNCPSAAPDPEQRLAQRLAH